MIKELGKEIQNGVWKPTKEAKDETQLLGEITCSFCERVWKLPLEEMLTEWVISDKKVLELLQSNPLLRNYCIPEEVLLALKDEHAIPGMFIIYDNTYMNNR